ncbi:MAG TPA: ribosome-associated translation inhibitor RaiA [Candidatus Limnocylindria bacterium]|nr:ribosome-associated translation inhibitor RaiA [Candidatus Limnocylindria bacterium]
MKTKLTARNLDLNDRLRGQVERKLRRLDRITHPEAEAEVELIANASRAADAAHVAEVTLDNNGTILRSSAAGPTPIAALDFALDKLERQIVREKEKPRSVRERRADEALEVLSREAVKSVSDEPDTGDGTEEPTNGPRVVKIKRFDMAPMFEEDAIAQMEELGHAFFVFLDAETDSISVVYRRRDGTYGLIQPVVDKAGVAR